VVWLAVLALSAAVQAQALAPRYAMVIGNAAYRHVDNLPNAANDAADMA
jgi:hypothetical protein